MDKAKLKKMQELMGELKNLLEADAFDPIKEFFGAKS